MGQSRKYLTVAEAYDQAVIDIRNRGHSIAGAIEQVAAFFGTSASRVKRFIYYGEDDNPALRRLVNERYIAHLEAEQQDINRRIEALRKRIEEVRAQ